MAEQEVIVLGIVGMVPKGEYNSEINYEKLNVVSYNGSSYCAKRDVVGIAPTNTDYWSLIAEKGEQGSQGIQGAQGIQGIPGEPGGVPLVASSVSEMTDTDSVYVNTTDGYWYYYDSSEWVQGGIYQASVNSDDVDYLLENHKQIKNFNGDCLLTEQGTFSSEDITIDGTATNRARSEVFTFTGNVDIEILDKDYYFSVLQQDNLGNVTTITTNFGNNLVVSGTRTSYTQKFSYYNTDNTNIYRILIRNIDNSAFADVPILKITTKDYNIKDINNNIVRNVAVYHGSFESSDITRNVYMTAMNRLKTGIIKPDKKIHFEITDDDYFFLLFKQTGETVTSTTNNLNAVLEPLDNTIYRILIRKVDNTEITQAEIPENLLICYYDDSYYNQLKKDISNVDPIGDDYKQLIRSNANNILRQSYINQFAFKDLDDGYISIGFDDGNADCLDAIEYCHTKGVSCYLALVPQRSEIEDVNDMAVALLSYGGEICSHNSTVVTPEVQADEETMFSLFFNTKYYLENKYKTKVRGIIQAGGTGQNTESKSLDDKWSRCAGYEYSDYYGNTIPYNLGRRNLTRFTHEQQTTLINQAKQNHEWQIWFCHHINGQETNAYDNGYQLSDFKYFVDECQRIGVQIVIPYYVISTFGTTELEKRVSSLEN